MGEDGLDPALPIESLNRVFSVSFHVLRESSPSLWHTGSAEGRDCHLEESQAQR